jgi:hypothetical protein
MKMRIATNIALSTLIVVAVATTPVWAQQALPGQDVKSLAGKWVGWATPTSGSNFPLSVQVEPDGSYTSTMGASIGKGMITMDGGKLMAEGQLVTGTGTAAAGTGRSQLTLTSKDGKQMITGAGRDDRGPYNFQLTKQ